ncbi:MAG: hypothetical protein P1V97_30285, partial [Planctomycetota bacterium]|nr:hypothetical protein [Planctomycetota bacterium]
FLPVSIILGFFISIFPGCFILGPILWEQAQINGAPYQVGDYVQIVGGEWDGEITEVRMLWQHGQPCLDLGPEAAENHNDIFNESSVILVWRAKSSKPQAPAPQAKDLKDPEGNAAVSLPS